jgi:hypothetical protein
LNFVGVGEGGARGVVRCRGVAIQALKKQRCARNLPDGQIKRASAKLESSPFVKNILIFRNCKSIYINRYPASLEGRFAIVTDVRRDAVDADGASDESA